MSAPRFHHQWIPDKLYVERANPADVVAALRSLRAPAGDFAAQLVGRRGDRDRRWDGLATAAVAIRAPTALPWATPKVP